MDDQTSSSTFRHEFDIHSRNTIRAVENEVSTAQAHYLPTTPMVQATARSTITLSPRQHLAPRSDHQSTASPSSVRTYLHEEQSSNGERSIRPNHEDQPNSISGCIINALRTFVRSDLQQNPQQADGFIDIILQKNMQGIRSKKLSQSDRQSGSHGGVRSASSLGANNTTVNESSSYSSGGRYTSSSRSASFTMPSLRSSSLTDDGPGRPGIDIPTSQAVVFVQSASESKHTLVNPFKILYENIPRLPKGRRLRRILFGDRRRKQKSGVRTGEQHDWVEGSPTKDTPLPSENSAQTNETPSIMTLSQSAAASHHSNNLRSDAAPMCYESSSVATGPSSPISFRAIVDKWLYTPPQSRSGRQDREAGTIDNNKPRGDFHGEQNGISGHYFPMPPHQPSPPMDPTAEYVQEYHTGYSPPHPRNPDSDYQFTITMHVYKRPRQPTKPHPNTPQPETPSPNQPPSISLPPRRHRYLPNELSSNEQQIHTTQPLYPPFPHPEPHPDHLLSPLNPPPNVRSRQPRHNIPARYVRGRQHQHQHQHLHQRRPGLRTTNIRPSLIPRPQTMYHRPDPQVYQRRRRYSESDVDFEADGEEGSDWTDWEASSVVRRAKERIEMRAGATARERAGRFKLDLGDGSA